jgi:hypothetical protein
MPIHFRRFWARWLFSGLNSHRKPLKYPRYHDGHNYYNMQQLLDESQVHSNTHWQKQNAKNARSVNGSQKGQSFRPGLPVAGV